MSESASSDSSRRLPTSFKLPSGKQVDISVLTQNLVIAPSEENEKEVWDRNTLLNEIKSRLMTEKI